LPFPYAISDFVAAMPAVVQDGAARVSGTLQQFVIQTITERYSKDAPLYVVSDIPGTGTNLIGTPTVPEGQPGVFEPGFSIIDSIEYPIEQVPPQLVLDSDIRLYRTPSGYQIMLSFDTPGTNEVLRTTWTSRHSSDGSTVPDKDFYAVVDYASSLALEALAATYVQTGDNTLQADIVNYRTKSQEYLTLAKAIRKRYFVHMGVTEDAAGDEQAPAFAIGNQYLEQNSGVDRLVHGKYSR
jgi:hypothetical protein